MKVEQLYTKCLAQGAYYIESNGEAAIIDPLRETEPYIELAEENNKTIVALESTTMETFFEMLEKVFHNHYNYRCLMLSFVHIMQRNPLVARRYSKTQSHRNETWYKNIAALKKGKYIKANEQEVEFLVSAIALIARFWLSAAAASCTSRARRN